MQLEPPSCRALGWAGSLLPAFACSQSPSFSQVWSQGDPMDASDQGPEGMLSKPCNWKILQLEAFGGNGTSVPMTRQAGP